MVHLRPVEPEDLELLYTIENDPELWDISNTDAPYSKYALKRYIASAASIYEVGSLRLIVCINEGTINNKPVGIVDLINYVPLSAKAEVAIALLKAYRGKGIGSQALDQLEQYAKQQLRMHSLHAYVPVHNKCSHALFEHNKYQLVAQLPDWHYNKGKYENAALYMKIL